MLARSSSGWNDFLPYAVSTRPGNRTLRELWEMVTGAFRITASGRKFLCPLSEASRVFPSFSISVGLMNPAAFRARSARVPTPNLLSSEEMWNFTVRTVMFNLDAISLFARLHNTASSTSRCRALKDAGHAIARPSFRSSSVRRTSRDTRDCSAGTMT